jgi:catechol 2,3-dioxygenase-like lactoylglutathione lyase family enzyme
VNGMPEVTQLRLVVTASDHDQALAFYRDVLGLPQRAAYASPSGRVTILEAGHATLELADPPHAAYVDAIEVGRRVAGHVRVAFEVDDTAATPPSWPPLEPPSSLSQRRPRGDPSTRGCKARPGCSSPCSPPSTQYHGLAVDTKGRPPA